MAPIIGVAVLTYAAALGAAALRRYPRVPGHRLALRYAHATFGWLFFFYPLERVGEMSKGLLTWT